MPGLEARRRRRTANAEPAVGRGARLNRLSRSCGRHHRQHVPVDGSSETSAPLMVGLSPSFTAADARGTCACRAVSRCPQALRRALRGAAGRVERRTHAATVPRCQPSARRIAADLFLVVEAEGFRSRGRSKLTGGLRALRGRGVDRAPTPPSSAAPWRGARSHDRVVVGVEND